MAAHKLDILYIEDDEDHMILFMDVLSSIDSFAYNIVHKESLGAGIEEVLSHHFDLVILDLGLPESQGLDTLSRFIAHCSNVPIVVLTTNEDLQLSVKAIKAGAQDFLVKGDITPNTLARALRYSIERFEVLNELEEKNKSLNTFAIAASHDLKTPLRNILLIIDFFRSDFGDKLPPEGVESLDRIRDAGTRLHGLIDSLMEFMKAETKVVNAASVSVELCAREALSLLSFAIEQTHAEVTVDPGLPRVIANEGLLIRVFQNLIGNALKYIKGRAPKIRIGAREDLNEVIVYVADNGIGIATQYYERIFEPLKRLHTQQEYPGSGIGLAICKRIVAAHGGRIWVESKPGEGSTFYFALPKSQQASAAA
ncbi:MAG TPA: ATP-binding protein [Gammaproteobacteria bacterium]|nr:ATP-binding protein [Gammaproteobacteria bacterium]